MVLRHYITQEKPFKNKTIVEYYLKTGGHVVYFLKETIKMEGNRCIVIPVKRLIALEIYSRGYCLKYKSF